VFCENNTENLGILAPFKYTIITMQNDQKCYDFAQKIVDFVDEVVWDDRDVSVGVKLAEADLLGSPVQIHIGLRELENGQVIIKENGQKITVGIDEIFSKLCRGC